MKYSTKFLLLASTAVLGFFSLETNVSANGVNDYVIGKGWRPSGNTVAISNVLPKNDYRNGAGRPEGVIVHETANSSDKWNNNAIWSEINYMLGHYNSAFVHSFVDANNRIEIADSDYLSWGAGPSGNSRYIQTEQVEVEGKDAFAGELYNLATIQARYLQRYNLKPVLGQTVFSHAMISNIFGESDHTDPTGYWADMAARFYGTTYTMNDYEYLLEYVYNQLAGGLRWEDGNLHGYDQNGNRLYNVWWNFNGHYYYFDGNGNALMNLQNLNGKWYFFDQGAQVRNKWWGANNNWYYFDADGVAKT
ncbi:peptidoglycan recognition protein family protein, partial [Weissella confusa]|uniref:peptidoglycan recognition protein family protein n=1 Tax=Weissella confusa TaxID=1583 RepID=UPI0018F21C36